ncbi:SSU ribosomal protein S20P [Desulfocicer vacuolatum DSM 3385]|uniref:Small ribosomal subunit protein bS20 n=1 Tax=Desulfocicer vacuolatum DSM 3385 TaxID=1121400 RepID=A0A1W2B8X4_9BACT|nr:30S ribosomal protein S20 [Desulfocicer vacuolatum]SMC69379.1 SSU ribosomal protein S20P [Desulfocicer vacuolatum DSM 3385]
MANHKSALKRAKQSENRRLRNKSTKSAMNTSIKKVQAAAQEDSNENAQELFKAAQATIAKAAKKGVIHKNTAARKISRLSRILN